MESYPGNTLAKMRLCFSREGNLRFLSHLEGIDLFRKIFRRANFPLAYTSGFQPRMKVSFGPAISVGYESKSEYLDLELVRRMESREIWSALEGQLPKGLDLLKVKILPFFSPSLETILNLAEYEISLPDQEINQAAEKIAEFLKLEKIEIAKEKNGKIIDLKSLIREMKFEQNKIKLFLRFYPQRNIKPEQIIAKIFGLSQEESRQLEICRVALYEEKPDGTLVSP